MSEAKDRSGPPEDYSECDDRCGNWTGVGGRCWACIVSRASADQRAAALHAQATAFYPDWTPTIPAPEPAKPQHPERRAGQTWRCNGGPAFTLVKRHDYVSREAWSADDGQGWVGWDIPGCMTLIADAPAPEATAPAPLPAGKVEAASAHNFSDPYCHNFNRPDIGDTRMVRCCSACGRAKNADNIGGPCRPVPWREVFEARINRDYEATSVLRADTPQLIDRRRSYQPMDDSFAEDAK